MCVDIKRRSKNSKLSKLKNCNNHPDNSFNNFALRKLKNQNQAKFCQNVVCKKYQIFKVHFKFNGDINFSKAFDFWKNVKKASKSVLVLVCVQWNLMIFTTSSVMVVNEKFRKENERWWPSSRAPLMKCVIVE